VRFTEEGGGDDSVIRIHTVRNRKEAYR